MIKVHDEEDCAGRTCPFHNPSDHHMRDWPTSIRMDRHDKLTERKCPHGIGHPDPDSVDYLRPFFGNTVGIHGCDGCCRKE